MQLWEPEILHNLSSVVPTCWVYTCKLWSRGNTGMIWCSILYINFVGNVWTWPAVQFALCSLDQLQIFKPLAPSIRYGPIITHCGAVNAKVRYRLRTLIAFLMQLSFDFQFPAHHTGNLIPVLIIKANKMHYFSNLFWYRVLHVLDRHTVHHQES